jgi:hypothetical protein
VPKAAALILEVLRATSSSPEGYGQLALTQSAMCLSATNSLELAVQLHAAADALEAGGVPSVGADEDEMSTYEEDVVRLRQALGSEAFDRAHNIGLDWEQAHRLATAQLTLLVARTDVG